MTINKIPNNKSTTSTLARPSVCSQCNHDTVANSWLKPEIVLLCALGTFGISAVIWTITSPHQNPVRANVASHAVPGRRALAGASEMERLFAQAGAMPVHVVAPVRVPPKMVSAVPQTQAQPQPQPKKQFVAFKPTAAVVKIDAPAAEPKAAEIKDDQVDEVAEYNRALAAFFEKKKSAAPDTVDGADQSTPVEPPTYEEWLKAGKPGF
jgi:hypothetical protein